MKIAMMASGTAAEVRRAVALAEEFAKRAQLSVRTCAGDAETLSAAVRRGGFDAWLREMDGTRHARDAGSPREVVLHILEPHTADVLEVAAGARWFRLRGRRVDLATRPVLMRILWTLVRARVESPGRVVALDDAVAAVWPNERMQRGSAENRMRVALSTLRSLGLRGLIASRDGGVLLEASVEVESISDAEDAARRQTGSRTR